MKTPISKSNVYYTLVTSQDEAITLNNDAFNKFSDITNRNNLYSVKPDAKNNGKGVSIPALPHVSSIIHKHKHLLEKGERLKTIIPPGSVFVSCRKIKQLVAF